MELELNMAEKWNPIDIKVIGLNTQGLKSNGPYVTNLISGYDIIFLSEHWLSNAEKLIIEKMMKPHNSLHFTSAKKQIMGRPYGWNCFIVITWFVITCVAVQHSILLKTTNPHCFMMSPNVVWYTNKVKNVLLTYIKYEKTL